MSPALWHVVLGGAFIPTGIGAIAWADADQLSGTLAGEYDGVLRPPLTAYAGWYDAHDAILVDFAMVRFSTATWSDTPSAESLGATRLGLDYRRYLPAADAGPGKVDMYGDVGLYGILPSAKDTSEAYTEEDQASADEASGELRARIGGVGGRLGIGAGYRLGEPASVTIGVRGAVAVHRAQATLETGYQVSVIVAPEAALTLEFRR